MKKTIENINSKRIEAITQAHLDAKCVQIALGLNEAEKELLVIYLMEKYQKNLKINK